MTVSLATPEMSCDQPFDVTTHDVICLVKRHAYELAFALPPSHVIADETQLRFHVRVKWPCQAGGFVLSLEDVEHFYEDLLQMLEYLHTERQKIAMSKPVA